MTVSDRLSNSTDASLRAPYAAPRDADHRGNGVGVRTEVRAGAARLAPFVPREFRDVARRNAERDMTVVPSAERLFVSPAELRAQHFVSPADTVPAADSATAEQHAAALADKGMDTESQDSAEFVGEFDGPTLAADLPWIDAFAADDTEVEDEWPMGEAGKRLDELTQSLTSLDASRARQEAAGSAELRTPEMDESEHPMWNEEEWIDIMPTPLPSSANAELNNLISQSDVSDASANEPFTAPTEESFAPKTTPAQVVGAESAARALEGLAQRVRAGQVQVPAFQAGVAEEAMLAGLLASMLGWRQ